MKPKTRILQCLTACSMALFICFDSALSQVYDYTGCGRIDAGKEETIKRVFGRLKYTELLREVVDCRTEMGSTLVDACVIKVETAALMSLLNQRYNKSIEPVEYLPGVIQALLKRHDLQLGILFRLDENSTAIFTSHGIFGEYPEADVLIFRARSCKAVDAH